MSVILSILMATATLIFLLRRALASKEPVHSPSQSAVLITGGGRGIGRATAEYLKKSGYTVLVTVRKPADYDALLQLLDESHQVILPVLFDVTNDSQTKSAVERVTNVLKDTNTKLVAIINNAGINPEGDDMAKAFAKGDKPDKVLADPSVASRVLETNVVGVIRVTRAFLPLLAENGRIVNLGSYFGSIAGKAGIGHAAYETSKFALEGLSDNMRRSLKNERQIKVCLIKPGNIQTDMNTILGEVSADVVAKDIKHAVESPNPRARYFPGKVQGMPCRLLCFLFEMLPCSITDQF